MGLLQDWGIASALQQTFSQGFSSPLNRFPARIHRRGTRSNPYATRTGLWRERTPPVTAVTQVQRRSFHDFAKAGPAVRNQTIRSE